VEYPLDKAKLPRGFSYPIKRSILDRHLEAIGAPIFVVYFRFARGSSGSIHVEYHGEHDSLSEHPAGKFSLTIYCLPSHLRAHGEEAVVQTGLPLICEWIAKAIQADPVWRSTTHRVRFSCAEPERGLIQ
jgi:hypothetical protein